MNTSIILWVNRIKMHLYLIFFLFFVALSTHAQNRWSLTLRPAVDLATRNLGTTELNTGFGIEGTFSYRFMPHLSAFTGWGWNKFSADQSSLGNKLDFEETGYTLGLLFIHPISNSGIQFLLGGGGIYKHLEVENNTGEIIADSGHGLGWQVEGGLSVGLGNKFSLMPSIRYQALSRELKLNTSNIPVDLNYISLGLGLSWRF